MPRKKKEKLTPNQLLEQAKKYIEDGIKEMKDEQAKDNARKALISMRNAIIIEKTRGDNKCNLCQHTRRCPFSLTYSVYPLDSGEYLYCPKEGCHPRYSLSYERLRKLSRLHLN